MPEEYRFLLIGDAPDDPWRQVIEEASAALGLLQAVKEIDTFRLIRQQDYDIIIIDAAKVEDAFGLTSCIRTRMPEAKIVIVTASPTWRRARAAFRAGATDYIRKSMNTKQISCVLQTTMGKMPPPWRR